MQIADIDFCTLEDLNALYELECECFDFPWERQVMMKDLDNQGELVYLKACFSGTIAGFAVLGRQGRTSHLLNLAVAGLYRRRGVALQLLIASEEVAHEWSCLRMRLELRSSNRTARDLYTKVGFKYEARARAYYADGEDAIVMIASLPLKIA